MSSEIRNPSLEISLPEFQRQLDRAIAAPEISTDAFVALVVDDQHWLIDLAHLSEASVPPALSRTGRMPPWIVGIGSFRGQVHTVVDMRQVLLGQRTPNTQQAWATPLHSRWGGALALLWPQMVGLIGKPELALSSHLPINRWSQRAYQDKQGLVWHEFNVEAFTASEFFGNEAPVGARAEQHE